MKNLIIVLKKFQRIKSLKVYFLIFISGSIAHSVLAQNSWEPPNSVISTNNNLVSIKAPNDWQYIWTNGDNEVMGLAGGGTKTISCDCLTNGQCKPFVATAPLLGTSIGCQGTCNKCTMTQTQSTAPSGDIISGGYYNISLGAVFLRNGDSAPSVFQELTTLPEFKTQLELIYRTAYGRNPIQYGNLNDENELIAPDGYLIVGVKIFGRGCIIVVPQDYAQTAAGGGSTSASCACSEGTCTIKQVNLGILKSTTCEGDCKGTCTLTLGSNSTSNTSYIINIRSYDF
jgi:hypothetical protein